MPDLLVHFVCKSKAHLAAARDLGLLSLNEGEWAYCPLAGADANHEWQAIDPVRFEQLIARPHVRESASTS